MVASVILGSKIPTSTVNSFLIVSSFVMYPLRIGAFFDSFYAYGASAYFLVDVVCGDDFVFSLKGNLDPFVDGST